MYHTFELAAERTTRSNDVADIKAENDSQLIEQGKY